MDVVQKALANMKRFEKLNPSIVNAIEEGVLVAFYDAETSRVITKEVVEGTLKVQIIKGSYFIPKHN
ncbi:hypothetical protein [Paenibacillus endoradicis]|uniref:hypothetical protein n=1 Tax=Paenibacillus endoradicis TaxID=2972487 RepID=UPI0021599395|nr:hypothetical protein [Paenibacillus endoradicis]MCR8658952.1 hypothetical protein [Paenibacillus endoradicis]